MACVKCDDRGAYGVTEPAETRTLSDGTTMVFGPCFSSSLCSCRVGLPPRGGDARWWSLEHVFRADVGIPIGDESVSVTVDAEVPISADNFRVHRRGNRYYPTLIEVEAPPSMTLHADTARDLARVLLQAADAADAIDGPDMDVCGHWAPCACQEKAAGR